MRRPAAKWDIAATWGMATRPPRPKGGPAPRSLHRDQTERVWYGSRQRAGHAQGETSVRAVRARNRPRSGRTSGRTVARSHRRRAAQRHLLRPSRHGRGKQQRGTCDGADEIPPGGRRDHERVPRERGTSDHHEPRRAPLRQCRDPGSSRRATLRRRWSRTSRCIGVRPLRPSRTTGISVAGIHRAEGNGSSKCRTRAASVRAAPPGRRSAGLSIGGGGGEPCRWPESERETGDVRAEPSGRCGAARCEAAHAPRYRQGNGSGVVLRPAKHPA